MHDSSRPAPLTPVSERDGAAHTLTFAYETAMMRLQAGDDPGTAVMDVLSTLQQWVSANVDGCICREGNVVAVRPGVSA